MPDAMTTLRRVLEAQTMEGVVSIYGFGSRATGRAHRDSDVDIGVLLDRDVYPDRRGRFEARLGLTGSIGRALERNDIDVVVLNDAPPHLARAIVVHGLRLFSRNDAEDRAFVRDVQLRAADVEPFLRRTRLVKLAAVLR
jgi:predicted nucleotidyltransferase